MTASLTAGQDAGAVDTTQTTTSEIWQTVQQNAVEGGSNQAQNWLAPDPLGGTLRQYNQVASQAY